MFANCDLKAYELNDENVFLGIVRFNDVLLSRGDFTRPFLKDFRPKTIASIGKRDYEKTDAFIIASLNDYYKRITSSGTEEERTLMNQNYNRLYSSWTSLNDAKTKHDYKMMETSYEEISYQLYLIGYKMSNS